jgi:Domain of unknown function (DUF4382)
MKKNKLLFYLTVSLLILSFFFVACNKELNSESNLVPAGKNELKIMLTDDPSIIFDSIFLDIQRVEVKVERVNGSEHWDTLSIRAGIYNILRFRNGLDTLLAVGYVPDGEIEKIRITLGNNNSVVLNGVSIPLFLHNNQHQIIVNIDGDVDHLDPDHLRLWLDFDGHGSIRFHNGRLELDLHIGHFSHHNSGELEGKIRPSDAFPVLVRAVSGTDTLIAIPEHDGEFKIRGIRSSTVNLIITPSNGYRDSVITNIPIRRGDETEIGTIVLHR